MFLYMTSYIQYSSGQANQWMGYGVKISRPRNFVSQFIRAFCFGPNHGGRFHILTLLCLRKITATLPTVVEYMREKSASYLRRTQYSIVVRLLRAIESSLNFAEKFIVWRYCVLACR